jgi:hypothetical protein
MWGERIVDALPARSHRAFSKKASKVKVQIRWSLSSEFAELLDGDLELGILLDPEDER